MKCQVCELWKEIMRKQKIQIEKLYDDCECTEGHGDVICSECKEHSEYCPELGTDCCNATPIYYDRGDIER